MTLPPSTMKPPAPRPSTGPARAIRGRIVSASARFDGSIIPAGNASIELSPARIGQKLIDNHVRDGCETVRWFWLDATEATNSRASVSSGLPRSNTPWRFASAVNSETWSTRRRSANREQSLGFSSNLANLLIRKY